MLRQDLILNQTYIINVSTTEGTLNSEEHKMEQRISTNPKNLRTSFRRINLVPSVMVHAFNLSNPEIKAGRSQWVAGQPVTQWDSISKKKKN